MSKLEKITFSAEGEEAVDFYVLEQTRIGGYNYILVTDTEEGDGEALILKDLSKDGDEEGLYEIVEDDEELDKAFLMFKDRCADLFDFAD